MNKIPKEREDNVLLSLTTAHLKEVSTGSLREEPGYEDEMNGFTKIICFIVLFLIYNLLILT